jgi:hypothetical protein
MRRGSAKIMNGHFVRFIICKYIYRFNECYKFEFSRKIAYGDLIVEEGLSDEECPDSPNNRPSVAAQLLGNLGESMIPLLIALFFSKKIVGKKMCGGRFGQGLMSKIFVSTLMSKRGRKLKSSGVKSSGRESRRSSVGSGDESRVSSVHVSAAFSSSHQESSGYDASESSGDSSGDSDDGTKSGTQNTEAERNRAGSSELSRNRTGSSELGRNRTGSNSSLNRNKTGSNSSLNRNRTGSNSSLNRNRTGSNSSLKSSSEGSSGESS